MKVTEYGPGEYRYEQEKSDSSDSDTPESDDGYESSDADDYGYAKARSSHSKHSRKAITGPSDRSYHGGSKHGHGSRYDTHSKKHKGRGKGKHRERTETVFAKVRGIKESVTGETTQWIGHDGVVKTTTVTTTRLTTVKYSHVGSRPDWD